MRLLKECLKECLDGSVCVLLRGGGGGGGSAIISCRFNFFLIKLISAYIEARI